MIYALQCFQNTTLNLRCLVCFFVFSWLTDKLTWIIRTADMDTEKRWSIDILGQKRTLKIYYFILANYDSLVRRYTSTCDEDCLFKIRKLFLVKEYHEIRLNQFIEHLYTGIIYTLYCKMQQLYNDKLDQLIEKQT